MTAKEFLRSVRNSEKRIQTLREQIDRKTDQLTSIAAHYGYKTGQNADNPGHMASVNASIVELRRKLMETVEISIQKRLEAIRIINLIEDEKCRMILTSYYILGFDWLEVAERMSYDLRWVYRIHGKALTEFERLQNTPLQAT